MTTVQTGRNAPGSTAVPNHGGSSFSDEARRDATAIAKAVEGRAEQGFESVKEQAAGRAEGVASAIDTLAHELRDNDEGWLGDKAEALAATLRRTGQNIQDRRVAELADDAREWSKNPALFLGGAFALGLVAGRFLKSSARHADAQIPATSAIRNPHNEVTR